MAAGSARIVRYILFAFFGVMVLYFMSSSSIPRPPLPTTTNLPNMAWKGKQGESAPQAPAGDVDTPPPMTLETVAEKPMATSTSPVVVDSAASAPAVNAPKQHNEAAVASTHSAGDKSGERANATFVTLARNSDLWEIVKSIRQVEDRFNRNYHYDWVFLNDKPFDETFEAVTTSLISGKTHYGEISSEHWSFPDHIDQDKARRVREDMAARKIIYGDSISYRHMCRFESGFFFQHPLMKQFEWYWRVEPSIELYCDIGYDTFKYMRDHGKKYSFVLSLYEYVETIPTLWDSVKTFMQEHPEHIAEGNSMEFLSDDKGETYNHCHFWSNFEIGNLDWLRSQAYTDYFNRLDKDGGFFYERWGDAPVHSIAAGLLLKKEEIHFFNDIAYYHVPFTHCPTGEQFKLDHKCSCNPKDNFDWKGYSCTTRFFDMNKMEKPAGYKSEAD
ncbi:MAG: hypothetical protein Q9207_008175 [Kuettlingeria erythrocarpa]